MSEELIDLVKAVNRQLRSPNRKVLWKHNGLRHSFISYRVSETQNVAQAAIEAGNSPQITFSNYRELVGPAEAKKWF